MNKLLLLFSFAPLLFADTIGGIAVTVDDETITLYEIKQEQEISKQNIKNTVDQLIREKLEHIEAKKRNISVSNQEVLDDLNKMAEQNNMTLTQLFEAMSSVRHLSESQTKRKTKEKILKEKLFNAIAMSQIEEPTEDEIQEFYELHLSEYQIPKSIDTVVYLCEDKNALQQKISNPMMYLPQVTTQNQTLQTAKMNPRLVQLLMKTSDSSFTPILPQMGKSGHMAFYVLRKNELNSPSLEVIRPQVQNQMVQANREQILNDHFQRMRLNADVKVLRLPE